MLVYFLSFLTRQQLSIHQETNTEILTIADRHQVFYWFRGTETQLSYQPITEQIACFEKLVYNVRAEHA